MQYVAMRQVVHVPAHELRVRSGERFAHVFGFDLAIGTRAIRGAAMSFEGGLFFRRGLGIPIAVYPCGWPDRPGVRYYTVFRGIFRPQKTIAHDNEVAW